MVYDSDLYCYKDGDEDGAEFEDDDDDKDEEDWMDTNPFDDY